MKKNNLILLVVFVAIWIVVGILIVKHGATSATEFFGFPGTHDFLEYWSAFQLYWSGANPYDPAALLSLERSIGWPESQALMMWNPPWLLTIFAPVLAQPFPIAALLWLGLNLTSIAITIWSAIEVLDTEHTEVLRNWLWSLVLSAISFPVWSALGLGQISLLLTAAVAVLYVALVRRHFLGAGFCLAFLSLKFHLFIPLLIFVAWYLVRRRELRPIVSGAFFLLAFVAATYIINVDAIRDWRASFLLTAADNVTSVMQWRTATLTSALSSVVFELTGKVPRWPLLVLPGAGSLLFGAWLVFGRRDFSLQSRYLVALGISLLVSPFAWTFDHSALLLLTVALVPLLSNIPKRLRDSCLPLGGFVAIQILPFILFFAGFDKHHQYFWYSLCFLIFWSVTLRKFDRPFGGEIGNS